MEELISIIVPVYNIEDYIERCVESIRRQTYTNLEIILVDDGSTDNSGSICDRLENDDCRIKVIHKDNGGLSDSRNYGIEVSHGELLMFIDGDDEIASNMVEKLYGYLHSSDANIVRCRMVKIESERSYPTREYNYPFPFVEFSSNEALKKLFLNEIDCSVCLGIYRKENFDKLRFPYGRTNEDFAIMYQLFNSVNKIVYIQDVLYNYYYRENSITTTLFSIRQFDKYINCLDMIKYVERYCPEVSSEAHHYLQLQTMYLIKELLLRNLENDYYDLFKKMRCTIKKEFFRICISKWFSTKEKASIFTMEYMPKFYKKKHNKDNFN